jgi:4-amino-4-deoxy-L-arabinose transferase-like glycosyltransferase
MSLLMRTALKPKDPVVFSYLALRKAVGIVAVALPFAVSIPWLVLHHQIATSISAYYYTGMRTVFTGSLCAIAMFMLCARGYDPADEIFSVLSALCAIGVALFPTSPAVATNHQNHVSIAHYSFAATLFVILAIVCLFLFTMTVQGQPPTPEKIQRNRVYIGCGIAIVISLILLPIFTLLLKHPYGGITFETTSLLAFGLAWLVKGEMFLKDKNPAPAVTLTTDGHVFLDDPHPQ